MCISSFSLDPEEEIFFELVPVLLRLLLLLLLPIMMMMMGVCVCVCFTLLVVGRLS